MKLTREAIQRMVGGNVGSGYVGGSGGSGGGGGVGAAWVDENYVSKAFFNQLFAAKGMETVYTSDDDGETWTQDGDPTEITFLPNEMPSEVIEDGETAGTKVKTVRSLRDTKSLLGLWADQYLSALGRNSSSGGGGGGGGGVTSITAGTGLSGGTITSSGTIAINSTYQQYIQHGETAYNNLSNYLSKSGGSMLNTNLVTNMNADLLDGKHIVTPGSENVAGSYADRIPFIGSDYVMEVGRYIDFHLADGTGDFVTRVALDSTASGNTVALPKNTGTLALTSDLNGYATQSWVESKGYLTSVSFYDLSSHPTTLGGYGITDAKFGTTGTDYVPITLGNTTKNVLTNHQTVSGTFWGNSWSNGGTVNGTISAGSGGGGLEQFHYIELNSAGTLTNYGGFIDFHFNGSAGDYTTRIIEDAIGVLSIYGKGNTTPYNDKLAGLRIGSNVTDESYLQIGAIQIVYDYSNNALRVQSTTGGVANLYAMGAVSALGKSGGSGGGGDANESRSYTMPESGDSNKWHRLGNYTMNSNGQVVCLDIFTGNGYNGQPYQNSWARIILKRSANTSGTASVVSVTCEQFGRSLGDGKILVRVNATAYYAGQVWVKCPWSNPLGAYTVQGNYSSWLHNANNNEDTANPSYNQTTGYYDSTGSMSTTE